MQWGWEWSCVAAWYVLMCILRPSMKQRGSVCNAICVVLQNFQCNETSLWTLFSISRIRPVGVVPAAPGARPPGSPPPLPPRPAASWPRSTASAPSGSVVRAQCERDLSSAARKKVAYMTYISIIIKTTDMLKLGCALTCSHLLSISLPSNASILPFHPLRHPFACSLKYTKSWRLQSTWNEMSTHSQLHNWSMNHSYLWYLLWTSLSTHSLKNTSSLLVQQYC